MKRLYDARPSNIRPFMDRMKLHISELDLPNVHIQQRNLFLFQPWNTPWFHYINPFATYSKSTVVPVVFQRIFAYHRSQYSRYSGIYTDGSKRADYVGCGVVIEDFMHGYRLDTSCSVFTAEAVAIYRALQLIDSNRPRKYCIYTDSMSVLEALENYNDRCHPVVCNIFDITSRLYSKGFDIVFCWLPSHVGILGNEQADSAARSTTTHLPLAVPLLDMKRVILHHIFKMWQESWSQQLDNKLHSVKPVIGAWPVMPMGRTDVKLTRLRIGHTRFTHRHLLLVYGSARASVLKRLDTIHHSALRIYSCSFRTSPVTSLYVVCHQPPLELRRRQLSANYFIRAISVLSHPLKPFSLVIGLTRLYEARSFNIKPFSETAKAVLNDAHLNNINIQENNILAFPPWGFQIFNYINPFSGYDKAGTADVIYQTLFSFHRSKYSKYIPVYRDGSETAGHVGAYTPTVIEILILLRKLERKGFDISSWVPGHVGILGNEQADTAARSMSDHMQRPVCYRDLKTSTQNYIHRVWQETWDQNRSSTNCITFILPLLIGQHYQCKDMMSA
ncbi:RNase H domain-containing protein [Trichonephila clavipes]|nr:RNase H domain-containing protein [Trichonephila clavipes]